MDRYISRMVVPPVAQAEQLRAQLAAYEDELRRAYALLWQKQVALDAAADLISDLKTKLQVKQHEHDANSPH